MVINIPHECDPISIANTLNEVGLITMSHAVEVINADPWVYIKFSFKHWWVLILKIGLRLGPIGYNRSKKATLSRVRLQSIYGPLSSERPTPRPEFHVVAHTTTSDVSMALGRSNGISQRLALKESRQWMSERRVVLFSFFFLHIVLLYIVQGNIVKQWFRLYVLPCLNISNK